jgi:hypothetical protein
MGAFPPNSQAAQLYGRRPARGVAEVKRLAALSREEYAVERKTAAAGVRCSLRAAFSAGISSGSTRYLIGDGRTVFIQCLSAPRSLAIAAGQIVHPT